MSLRSGELSGLWFIRCQQLFDSTLPTGAYAHSMGLEGLVQLGEISSMDDLDEFIRNEVANNLIHVELTLMRHAWMAVDSGSLETLVEIDRTMGALIPTAELRTASSRIGRQTWRLYQDLLRLDDDAVSTLMRTAEFFSSFNLCVVAGVLSACQEIPLENALQAYARQAVNNLLQASIKLLHSGPTEVQRRAYCIAPHIPDWIEASLSVRLEDAGSLAPRWDIGSARHLYADRRLYIS